MVTMMKIMILTLLFMLLATAIAFVPSCRTSSCRYPVDIVQNNIAATQPTLWHSSRSTFQTYMSDASSSSISTTEDTITLQLTKPFGMMLEEIEGTKGGGVQVTDVGETGSAVPYAEQIRNTQIITINTMDVRQYDFDQMMNYIGQLPTDAVATIEFQKPKEPLKIGTPVIMTVVTSNGDTIPINAKVGDNLRQTLLSNNIEVYQGMQKLSNCGGAGQCTLCAFDFIDSDGWEERSDYEANRLKKFPSARLTCLNNIQGPATIRKTQR